MSNWLSQDLLSTIVLSLTGVFILWCVIIGSRRWAEAQRLNNKSMALSAEAVADRKKILSVLEEIKSLLEGRKA